MKMKMVFAIIPLVFGVLLLLAGLLAFFVTDKVVKDRVRKFFPLRKDTLIYNEWAKPTGASYLQVYFLNIDNSDEVLKGAKPSLSQIGPYSYISMRTKHDIKFNKNGTVSYKQKREFTFDRTKSVGDEGDLIYTIGIARSLFMKVMTSYTGEKKWVQKILTEKGAHNVLRNNYVKKIMWKDIESGLASAYEYIKSQGIDLKGIHPHFGFFNPDTDFFRTDQLLTIDTGKANVNDFLKIVSLDGSNSLSIWNDRYANMINGTDATMFAPFLTASSVLYMFLADIGRSVYATYVGTSYVKDIPAYDFEIPDRVLAHHTENPENYGFCPSRFCPLAGAINVTKVHQNMPMLMTQPHFYKADPKFAAAVVGMAPKPEYKSRFQIEPKTGLPLRVQNKWQVNIRLERVEGILESDKVPTFVMPVMWYNESIEISDELAETIRSRILRVNTIGYKVGIALMVFGGFFIVLAGVLGVVYCVLKRRSRNINVIQTDD